MLTQSKIDKFNAIARDLYVKEYLGVDGYGKDKEFLYNRPHRPW